MKPLPDPKSPVAQGREIRLLPRHWEWLDRQPRGASATMRLMIESARRDAHGRFAVEAAKERCYLYMRDAAGDRPRFEEACRALFAGDVALFEEMIAVWPADIQAKARQLAAATWAGGNDMDGHHG